MYEVTHFGAGQEGELPGRIRGEGHAEFPALLGVEPHGFGVIGRDDDKADVLISCQELPEVDVACLGHSAGMEGGDLVGVLVRHTDEAGCWLPGRHPHSGGVDAVFLQPDLVVGEVASHCADQQGIQAEQAEPEGDVGRGPATAHLEAVDEKRQ